MREVSTLSHKLTVLLAEHINLDDLIYDLCCERSLAEVLSALSSAADTFHQNTNCVAFREVADQCYRLAALCDEHDHFKQCVGG